ncbi:MAG TPA: tagaturonate reductase [Mobilitalea sp.]|nr:tagaturonate reductase [Mobilitalea sp.]
MEILNKSMTKPSERPVKILQFGEGNFLRGFVDYMIDIANETEVFNGNIAIIKPIPYGSLEVFERQECQYTVSLRGLENGEPKVVNRIIKSVSDALGAYEDYDSYMAYAKLDTLRFIVSNTTEAGIVYDDTDSFEDMPPKSFPGKLTKFLYERYKHFNGDKNKGLIMLPCELIENNGNTLKNCIIKYSKKWALGKNFTDWIETSCVFCNTLVDRIITGYPKEEAEKIWQEAGYKDELIVTGELFALWVIESDRDISGELPLDKANLPVIFTDNLQPYRERKVRILNGAHTGMVAASFLAGNDTVKEAMDDVSVRKFVLSLIFDEIIPTLTLPRNELEDFAYKVIERFKNPYIKHALLSISLNSVSKWKTRCLPSFRDYYRINGKLPACLTFSLAALISLYRGEMTDKDALTGYRNGTEYKIMDDEKVLMYFNGSLKKDNRTLAEGFLKNKEFLGEDMTKYPGLTDAVAEHLDNIQSLGMRKALEKVCAIAPSTSA